MPGVNVMTDQLNMVNIEEVRGLARIFTQRRRASEGFCLVVFRKESYLGTIASDEVITENDIKRRCERLGVRDGDTILRVNMGPQPLTIRDRVSVKDGYVCSYEMHLEFAVRDPQAFAVRYRQQSDPVNLARVAIEGYLQQYAARKLHDELREDMLRDQAEQALNDGSNRFFGLKVTRAHKCAIYADPQRAQELALQQKSRLHEAEIQQEEYLKILEAQAKANVRKVEVRSNDEVNSMQIETERKHQQEQSAFERNEEQKQKEHEMWLEGYLQVQRNKVREVTRIDEEQEKDHQLRLGEKDKAHQLLLEGRQSEFDREEMRREDVHRAEQNAFTKRKEIELSQFTRTDDIEKKEHELLLKAMEDAADRRRLLLDRTGETIIGQVNERLELHSGDQKDFDDILGEQLNTRDIFGTASQPGTRTSWREPLQITNTSASTPETPPTGAQPSASQANTFNAAPDAQPHAFNSAMPVEPAENRTLSRIGETETGALPGILRQQHSTINITDLGLTLLQIELSPTQREIAAASSSIAFVISSLSYAGPAQAARLATGDIIVEINSQELSSNQAIAQILQTYRPGASVTLCILRGEELMEIEINS